MDRLTSQLDEWLVGCAESKSDVRRVVHLMPAAGFPVLIR